MIGLPLFERAEPRVALRPYQIEGVEAIERCLFEEHHKRTLAVLATGLGKTMIFSEVARREVAKGHRVLVVAHRTELLEQAAAKLGALGLDVGLEQARNFAGGHSVVVASVQTLRGKRLRRWSPDHFSLVIIDEAHHAAALSYRQILDRFRESRVLGVTATPDRGDGKGLSALFGSVAYRMEIRDGIKGGWLAPVTATRVMVDGLDLSAVRITAGDFNQGELDLAMRAPEAVHGVAEPVVKLSGGRKTLLFSVTVEHARALANAINELAPNTATALDGTSSREYRSDVLRRYKAGEIRVLVNCALFTEGFDAPETSCVAIARPTKSRALYTQMVGRGTRIAPGKSDCLVIDFAGVAGRHSLVGPHDALAGEELGEAERRAIEVAMGGGGAKNVLMLIDDAKESVAAAEAAAEAARKERENRKPIQWSTLDVQLFGDESAGPEQWRGVPPTDGQIAYLERKGIDLRNIPDKARASAMIEGLRQRQTGDLCTYKQAKILSRYGIDVSNLRFHDARMLLDKLARNKWKPSESVMDLAKTISEFYSDH